MGKITNYYNKFLVLDKANNFYSATKVGWTTKEEQEIRFENLIDIGVSNEDSILDYGCGVGHLIDYLQKIHLQVKYSGIDIFYKYIELAKIYYPNKNFYVADIEQDRGIYDWVLASGVFSFDIKIEDIYKKIKLAMFKCNKGVAFNMLKENEKFNKWGLNSFDEEKVYEKLKKYYKNVKLINDYSEEDFTIHIFK